MSEFNVEEYFNSLPIDTKIISVHFKNLTYLPDLTRFIYLETLDCTYSKLTNLPDLPDSLILLNCSENKLISLPDLPKTLKHLNCQNNKLTNLPYLPENLESLSCETNYLTSLPNLPETILMMMCDNNPIYKVLENILFHTKINKLNNTINIINKFRELYYCIKYKNKFRKWLYEKVREPNAMKLYSPEYLMNELKDEETDLDEVLNAW